MVLPYPLAAPTPDGTGSAAPLALLLDAELGASGMVLIKSKWGNSYVTPGITYLSRNSAAKWQLIPVAKWENSYDTPGIFEFKEQLIPVAPPRQALGPRLGLVPPHLDRDGDVGQVDRGVETDLDAEEVADAEPLGVLHVEHGAVRREAQRGGIQGHFPPVHQGLDDDPGQVGRRLSSVVSQAGRVVNVRDSVFVLNPVKSNYITTPKTSH